MENWTRQQKWEAWKYQNIFTFSSKTQLRYRKQAVLQEVDFNKQIHTFYNKVQTQSFKMTTTPECNEELQKMI